MKKIIKRIMALMLSLVMVFGCVPSFINEASAGGEIKTIETILATVPGGFPTSTDDDIPDNAWVSEGKKLYISNSNLYVVYSSEGDGGFVKATNENATSIPDNKYTATTTNLTITFIMTDNKLTSIVITGNDDYEGTYEPVTLIEDAILSSTGVLTSKEHTLEYKVADDAPYTLTDDGKWYETNACEEQISTFSANTKVYKKLVLSPQSGYKFTTSTHISLSSEYGEVVEGSQQIVGGDLKFVVSKTIEGTKTVTVTIPTTAGLTVEEIRNSATLTDQANKAKFNTANIDNIQKRNIRIYGLKDDGTQDGLKASDYALEKDKEYMAVIQLKDEVEADLYKSVNVNDKTLYFSSSSTDAFTRQSDLIIIKYIFTANDPQPAPSGGGSSKKYKASDNKDTAEKVSGSGKKGSTRTITPIEGKKVSSVIVKDKDGNKVDVTLNEDGTYSFKQPASDVTIEVNYKNREITLNIGSTEAEVDGEKSNLDVCPVVRNDRTMLPIRYVAENLGAKVEWNEKKSDYVAITRGDTKIEITLGSDIMLVNGKEVKLDSVAFAENDRTYLPVRAISEALNAIVEWNEERPMEVKIYER